MITKLKTELDRINEGCGKKFTQAPFVETADKCGNVFQGYLYLCSKCRKEKETLKKVSLMWADETQNWIDKSIRELNVGNFVLEEECHKKIMELKEIKSLMEKA